MESTNALLNINNPLYSQIQLRLSRPDRRDGLGPYPRIAITHDPQLLPGPALGEGDLAGQRSVHENNRRDGLSPYPDGGVIPTVAIALNDDSMVLVHPKR